MKKYNIICFNLTNILYNVNYNLPTFTSTLSFDNHIFNVIRFIHYHPHSLRIVRRSINSRIAALIAFIYILPIFLLTKPYTITAPTNYPLLPPLNPSNLNDQRLKNHPTLKYQLHSTNLRSWSIAATYCWNSLSRSLRFNKTINQIHRYWRG